MIKLPLGIALAATLVVGTPAPQLACNGGTVAGAVRNALHLQQVVPAAYEPQMVELTAQSIRILGLESKDTGSGHRRLEAILVRQIDEALQCTEADQLPLSAPTTALLR